MEHWGDVSLAEATKTVLESYRNKCEFTIGKSVDGIDNTVGFRLGAYKGLDPQDNHSTSTSDVPVTGAAIRILKSLSDTTALHLRDLQD
ncbi:uncharacterized protein LOC119745999 isoform X4 [Patiria miniata]|uniref:Uncharacterized protein n=1 Tax=Patiria miniata TaxID=46514 RepID=A0A914BRT4_PATMI|nr:uncharacterized protein LOC119745999 isoform X4 [Patiria miniata]